MEKCEIAEIKCVTLQEDSRFLESWFFYHNNNYFANARVGIDIGRNTLFFAFIGEGKHDLAYWIITWSSDFDENLVFSKLNNHFHKISWQPEATILCALLVKAKIIRIERQNDESYFERNLSWFLRGNLSAYVLNCTVGLEPYNIPPFEIVNGNIKYRNASKILGKTIPQESYVKKIFGVEAFLKLISEKYESHEEWVDVLCDWAKENLTKNDKKSLKRYKGVTSVVNELAKKYPTVKIHDIADALLLAVA